MGGRLVDEKIGASLNVPGATYEDNYIVGAGIQRFIYRVGPLLLGYEAGAAARFGEGTTAELWSGTVGRLNDIRLLDNLYVAPQMTVGLSYVTAAQPGRELTLQESKPGRDAHLLFYLGPGLDFKTSPTSRYTLFWRLHHRSGAGETLGSMRGATNANVIGLKIDF
ncbi:hypothetical protein [Paracoccus sp. (in: a-proteobacteria)]|uniref:hypothetical protein n=1 Tax=Paracoccus sp. TaxID=267 RepID=UPI003A88BD6B